MPADKLFQPITRNYYPIAHNIRSLRVSFQVKIAVPSRVYKEAATQTLRSIVGSKPAAYLYTYRKLLARLGAVFLGTATLVAIVSFRNPGEVSVVTAIPTQNEVIQPAKPEAAVASKPVTEPITDPTTSIAPLIGDFGFSLGSPDRSVETRPSSKAKEPLTVPKPEAIPSPAVPAVAEVRQPVPEPAAAEKEFVEISVQLTIEDGRVAGAQIGNRQPGAEAFEATALHIARQRRYPPGTSRIETVVVRVANHLGRKEP